jgi:hypothetical protein
MIMTENKAQKTAIRQRMAETGEPYSVARHAVQASQPAAAGDWDEEYYADGAASEGITVAEFKAREAAGSLPPPGPVADAQAAGGPFRPPLREAALAGRRLARELRQQWRGDAPGMPPMPPMPPVPPVPPRFSEPARRSSRGRPGPLTEGEVRDLGPFLEAARAAADKAREAAALAAEWAARAQEQASREQERADRAEDWAGQEEQEGSDAAPERAELTRERAGQAEERAMQAQEWAELAQDRADEAQEWADQAAEWPLA